MQKFLLITLISFHIVLGSTIIQKNEINSKQDSQIDKAKWKYDKILNMKSKIKYIDEKNLLRKNNNVLSQFDTNYVVEIPIRKDSVGTYFAELKIGSNNQKFNLGLSLSSTNIIVPNSECKSDQCKFKAFYDHSTSTSYVKNDTQKEIAYQNNGNFTGYLSYDSIYVSGTTLSSFLFMEAIQYPHVMGTVNYDGIQGLFPSGTYKTDNTFLPQSFHTKDLQTRPRFSVFQSRDDNSDSSRLVIGAMNLKYYDITTYGEYPMNDQNSWSLGLLGICGFEKCKFGPYKKAIFSLSTENLSIRQSLKVLLNIPEKYWSGYQDCTEITSKSKKQIIFIINTGKSFGFDPKEYMDIRDGQCMTKVTTHSDDLGYDIIFGQAFMKKYFTIFDIEQKSIGIATALSPSKTRPLQIQ